MSPLGVMEKAISEMPLASQGFRDLDGAKWDKMNARSFLG